MLLDLTRRHRAHREGVPGHLLPEGLFSVRSVPPCEIHSFYERNSQIHRARIYQDVRIKEKIVHDRLAGSGDFGPLSNTRRYRPSLFDSSISRRQDGAHPRAAVFLMIAGQAAALRRFQFLHADLREAGNRVSEPPCRYGFRQNRLSSYTLRPISHRRRQSHFSPLARRFVDCALKLGRNQTEKNLRDG